MLKTLMEGAQTEKYELKYIKLHMIWNFIYKETYDEKNLIYEIYIYIWIIPDQYINYT